jgi:hypothetical protein
VPGQPELLVTGDDAGYVHLWNVHLGRHTTFKIHIENISCRQTCAPFDAKARATQSEVQPSAGRHANATRFYVRPL